MILIKSIEIAIVKEDRILILITPGLKERLATPYEKSINITEEMVRGRTYITADGRQIIIGMTKEVQDAIGLPYEVFENLNKELDTSREMLSRNRQYMADYQARVEGLSLFKRIKALFIGFR